MQLIDTVAAPAVASWLLLIPVSLCFSSIPAFAVCYRALPVCATGETTIVARHTSTSGRENAAELAALMATIDAGASGLTICRVSAEARLVGTAFDGVTALQVLSGSLRLSLPAGDFCVAHAGHLVLVPADIRPVIEVHGGTVSRVVNGRAALVRRDGWLIADAAGDEPVALVVAAARITGTAQRSLGHALVARIEDRPEGRGAVAMLRAEVERAQPGANTLAVTLMSLCIVIGLRVGLAAAGGAPATGPERRPSLDGALAAVRSRPADLHSVDTLARAAGMSRSTLVRHLRVTLRTTPAAFILRARLTEAASLLRTSELSIKEIAATTGFADRSHFSRSFVREFGSDPSRYRADAPAFSALTKPEAVTEQINEVAERFVVDGNI